MSFPPLVGGGGNKRVWRWERKSKGEKERKQGRIHGNTVADGWAGAVMQKLLGIQKCDGPTNGLTD